MLSGDRFPAAARRNTGLGIIALAGAQSATGLTAAWRRRPWRRHASRLSAGLQRSHLHAVRSNTSPLPRVRLSAERFTTTFLFISLVLSWIAFARVGFLPRRRTSGAAVLSPATSRSIGPAIDARDGSHAVVVTTVSAFVHPRFHRLHGRGFPTGPVSSAICRCSPSRFVDAGSRRQPVQLFFGWEGGGFCELYPDPITGITSRKRMPPPARLFMSTASAISAWRAAVLRCFMMTGAIDYGTIVHQAPTLHRQDPSPLFNWDIDALTLIFLPACSWSPLVRGRISAAPWLPDAMEGPTPLSCPYPAATIVRGRSFLVGPIVAAFPLAPAAADLRHLPSVATTAMFAATVGLVQNDNQAHHLPYSTCSQLGYMFRRPWGSCVLFGRHVPLSSPTRSSRAAAVF